MTTREEMVDQIERSMTANQAEAQKEVERIQLAASNYARLATKLESLLPSLVKALDKAGLGIDSFGYSASQDSTSLSVSIRAKPTSGKFKFIQFAGYDSRGCGKNRQRLEDKAGKLESALTDAMDVRVRVNPCSLEIKDIAKDKFVMIDFCVR
ncbi:hypothetical protein M0R72_09265 [Candidatus Pacearchaeota archaeon]|jgi:hypothetical protein|nr:hypothetical protein [Candidatus Pacearchaeota archaeon]